MENESAGVLLDLKYCERCGGLWLRPRVCEEVYCNGCARDMAELAPAGTGRGLGRRGGAQ
jgi:hypothetical protein